MNEKLSEYQIDLWSSKEQYPAGDNDRVDIFGRLLRRGDTVVFMGEGLTLTKPRPYGYHEQVYVINYNAPKWKVSNPNPEMRLEIELVNDVGQKQTTPYFNLIRINER